MPRTLEEVMASLPPEDRKEVEEGAAQLVSDYDRQRAEHRAFVRHAAAFAEFATSSGVSATIVVSTNTGDVEIRTPRDALQLRHKVLLRA